MVFFSLATQIMLPLQLTRIFDYQRPAAEQSRSEAARIGQVSGEQIADIQIELQEDRRKQADRRATERREKQQATFLNTRKIQGRRRSAGRRQSDIMAKYRPISLKG